VLRYYRLGIHSFLLRGFENPQDTVALGRDLIPLIRAGAIEIDREVQAQSRLSSPNGRRSIRWRPW
jgi:alkanesulfonate monooxygenase